MPKAAWTTSLGHASGMRARRWQWLAAAIALALCMGLLQLALAGSQDRLGGTVFSRRDRAYVVPRRRKSSTGTGLPFAKSWGAYSPAFPRDVYTVPRGCSVTMVRTIFAVFIRKAELHLHAGQRCEREQLSCTPRLTQM